MTTPEQRLQHRDWMRAYRARMSPEKRTLIRAKNVIASMAQRKTPEGQAARQRYLQSAKGRATVRRYSQTHPEMRRQSEAKVRARMRAFVSEYKKLPCVDCGCTYLHYVMDLDHVRGKKVANVSTLMLQRHSMARLLAEIEKCDVVCSNCHRERTHQRGN